MQSTKDRFENLRKNIKDSIEKCKEKETRDSLFKSVREALEEAYENTESDTINSELSMSIFMQGFNTGKLMQIASTVNSPLFGPLIGVPETTDSGAFPSVLAGFVGDSVVGSGKDAPVSEKWENLL